MTNLRLSKRSSDGWLSATTPRHATRAKREVLAAAGYEVSGPPALEFRKKHGDNLD